MPGISDYLVCGVLAGVGTSWDMAKSECENRGMYLAKIDDLAEANAVASFLDPALRDYWVGASNPTGGITGWQWLDKTPVPLGLFVAGTVMSPNYKCAAATTPAGLILGICGQTLGYVCEID